MSKKINLEDFFYDIEEAEKYAARKKDWHKNKGKRRVKDGYKEKYV